MSASPVCGSEQNDHIYSPIKNGEGGDNELRKRTIINDSAGLANGDRDRGNGEALGLDLRGKAD